MNNNLAGSTGKTHFKARRVISWILSFMMLFSLFPGSSLTFADYLQDSDDAAAAEETAAVAKGGGGGIAIDEDDEPADEAPAEDVNTEADAEEAALEEAADEAGDIDADEDAAAAEEPDLGDEDAAADDETAVEPEPEPDLEPADEDAIFIADDVVIEELKPEGGVMGVGDQYSVRYLVGNKVVVIQLVIEGNRARFPGAPDPTEFPAGAVSFLGWFEQGASDDNPYDFNTPVMDNLDLYARFSDRYLVQFLDGFGEVFKSVRVAQGSPVAAPTPIELESMLIPHNTVFDFWSLNSAAPYTRYNFSTIITADTVLYPALANKVHVYFVSYGSEVLPLELKQGDMATPPAVPSRDKYDFRFWSAIPGGSGTAYNWNQPVNADLVLYAYWIGKTNSAQYKVVWWVEAPNFTGTPDYKNASDYIFADSEIRMGTPGTTVSVTTLPPGPYETNDPVRYAEFQHSAPTVISAADNTIINVYLTRKTYRLTFALETQNHWLRFNGSTKMYYGSQYYIDVKFESNITDVWPCSATATFGPAGYSFHSWVPPDECNEGSDVLWLTRRNVVSAGMMPANPNDAGYTLEAFEDDRGEYNVRYWLEAFPEKTGTSRMFNGKKYVLEDQYTQDGVPELLPKTINGTKYADTDYSDTFNGTGYKDRDDHLFENLYYDRNVNDLIFDMGGAPVSIPTVKNIMYERPLAGFKPADPVWPGNTFKGWYKDGNRILEFDFSTAVMTPNTDMIVFAKWESLDHTVTFWDGNERLGTQGVRHGDPVDFSRLEFNGIVYEIGLKLPGKGVMLGWLFDPLGRNELSPYPIDHGVYHDFDLYVHWRTDGFKVTYYLGAAGAGSTVPTDANVYALGTYARVLKGNMIAPLSGTTFIGWRVNDAGTTYYPDSLLLITGDMDMYPYFAPDDNIANLIFDKNYPADPETVTRLVEKNTNVPLTDANIFSRIPPNMTLKGWQTAPNGGTFYLPTDFFPVGSANSYTLYAVWQSAEVNLTFDGNGDTLNTRKTVQVLRNTNVNINPLAPTVERIGRTFLGWSWVKDNPATLLTSPIINIDADTTLYALWTAVDEFVTLTFDGNGDINNTLVPVQVLIHDTVNLYNLGPKNLIKVGYEFDNTWSTVRNDATTRAITLKVDTDRIVYALYNGPINVTLTYNGNGDDNNTVYPIQVAIHDTINVDARGPVVTRFGYTFEGWSRSNDNDPAKRITAPIRIDADMIVYAIWKLIPEVDLVFDGNGAVNGLGNGTYTVKVNANTSPILADLQPTGNNAFRNAGYKQEGWLRVANDPTSVITTINVGLTGATVYANWVEAKINIIFEGNGGVNRANQSRVLVPAPVNTNGLILANYQPADMFVRTQYAFVGWTTRRDDPATLVTTVDSAEIDITVFALWELAPEVTITFDANGGFNDMGTTTYDVRVRGNQTQLLTPIEPTGLNEFRKLGQRRIAWTTEPDNAATAVTFLNLGTADVTVYALWEDAPPVDLIFDGNGGTSNGNNTFTVQVPVNSTQILADLAPTGAAAFRLAGHTLVGWTTVRNDRSTLTLTVDIRETNVTVYALYDAVPDVNLIFDGNGGRNGFNLTTFRVLVPVNVRQELALREPTGQYAFIRAGFVQDGWSTVRDDPTTRVDYADVAEADFTVYAIWVSMPDVQLIFNGNGGVNGLGNATYSALVPVNSTQQISTHAPTGNNMFTRQGFVFVDWTTVRDDSSTIVSQVNIGLTDVTVYALWTPAPNVFVIFDGNGGFNNAGQGSVPVSVVGNSTYVLLNIQPADMFTKSGNAFGGWTTVRDDASTLTANITVGITSVTVYALWIEVPDVNITFNGNGGFTAIGEATVDVPVPVYSTQILANIEPVFNRPGYVRTAWTMVANDPTTAVSVLTITDTGVTVFAFWQQVPDVFVIFNGNGGFNKLGNATYGVLVQVNSSQILADIEPTGDNMFIRQGHEFAGWTTTPNDSSTLVTTVNVGMVNVTVFALWNAVPDVDLIFDGNGGVNGAGASTYTVKVPVYSTQVLSARQPTDMFKKAGYAFVGWTTERDDPSTITDFVNILRDDVTVYAYYRDVPDVMLIFNGNGGVNRLGYTTYGKYVPVNSTQILANHQPTGDYMFRRAGFNFVGWTRIPNNDSTIVTQVDIGLLPVTVYALWNPGPDVNLIFDGNGGADATGNTTYSVLVPINSTQLLSYRAPIGAKMFTRPGYFFLGWTEVADDETTLVDLVEIYNDDVTVYALWTEAPPVMVIFNGNGGVNKAGAYIFTVNVPILSTQILADIQPTGDDMFKRPGYRFLYWTRTPNLPSSRVDTLNVGTQSITVYAFWDSVPDVMLVFDGNGGRNAGGATTFSVQVPVNSTQLLSNRAPTGADMFVRAGYKFVAWTTVANDDTTIVTEVDILEANVTVYALWNGPYNVNVVFNGNRGVNKAGDSTFTVSVLINSLQVTLATIEPTGDDAFLRAGYIQDGWSRIPDIESSKTTFVTILENDVTVFAFWKSVPDVNLIFDANGGINDNGNNTYSVLVPVNSTQVLANRQPTGANAFRRAGYRQDGWTTERNNPNTKTDVVFVGTGDFTVYANWISIPNVNITFDGNGGLNTTGDPTTIANVLANSRPTIAELEQDWDLDFTKPGYILIGWTTEKDNPATRITTVIVNEDPITLYALWQVIPKVNLIFDGNGGTVRATGAATYTVEVDTNSTVILADLVPSVYDMFYRAGFKFGGWALTNGGAAVTSVSIAAADVTVYAIWNDVKVNLVFNANGGAKANGDTTHTVQVAVNTTQTLAAIAPSGADAFKRSGFRLKGWSLTNNGAIVSTVDIVESDVEVFAIWESGQVNLIFDGNGGAKANGDTTHTVLVPINSTVLLSTVAPTGSNVFIRSGFVLTGWSTTRGGAPVISVDIFEADVTVFAVWTSKNVNLIFDANGGAKANGATTHSVSVPVYSVQTLAGLAPSGADAFKRAGYKLIGWSLDNIPVTTVEIEEADVTVKAIWQQVNVNMVFNGNGGAKPNGDTTHEANVPGNATVTIADYAPTGSDVFKNPGYKQDGWSLTPGGTPVTTVDTFEDDVDVFAVWVRADVNLIFDGNGGAKANGATTHSALVPVNTTVTVLDYAPTGADVFKRAGYKLTGWSLDGVPVTTVDIEETDVTVKAIWQQVNVNMVFNGNGGAKPNGDTTHDATVPGNATVTIAVYAPTGNDAFKNPGYKQDGWSLTPGGAPVTTVDTLEADVDVFAVWVRADVNLIFDGNGGAKSNGDTTHIALVPVNSTVTIANYAPTGADAFKNPGNKLLGWATTRDGAPVLTVITLEADVTVYAVWVQANVSLIFNGNEGRKANGATTHVVSVPVNSNLTISTYAPTGVDVFKRAGYSQTGWSLEPNGTPVLFVETEEVDVNVYAVWTKMADVNLIFNGNGGAAKNGATTYSTLVEVNSTVELATKQPTGDNMFRRAGYRFVGWSESVGGTVVTFVNIGETEFNVYAVWQKVPDVNLIFDANKKDIVQTYSVKVEVNQTLILADYAPKDTDMFDPPKGQKFSAWISDKNDKNSKITSTIEIYEEDVTVWALWVTGSINSDDDEEV